jgi:ribosomal protein S18 acetylase RimI-like enzyme
MTFQIRSFTEEDLPTLVRLLNEAHREPYEFTPYTEDELKSRIRERCFQIFMAVENGETVGSVAYNDGHWGEEIEWLTASKSSNRKIIENELLREAEKCVKRQVVFTAVDAGSPKTEEWIERGYKPEGGLYHMIARLDGIKPLPKVPEGIILRSLKPQEEKELVEAVNAGFGSERIRMGIIQLWRSEFPSFSEEWVHVAEHNNKIVSAVVSRPDMNYDKFFNGKRGYLGPAATLPECRGKNLASALTFRAMNFLFEKGMDSVALYTSEQNIPSIALLRKLGFEVGHHWKFMRKSLPQS